MIASGVEKLGKLTLGMMRESDTGAFPNQKILRGFGHDIGAVVRSMECRVENRATTMGKSYVLELKRSLDDDPYWPTMVEALDTAASASAGRYVHESALGGSAPKSRSVQEIWQHLDSTAIAELGNLSDLAGAMNVEALIRVRVRILTSVVRWWHLVLRVWQHGLAGPMGMQFASEVSLQWSALPDELRGFAKRL